MSATIRSRGDQSIDLGTLGTLNFRPRSRALEAIESACGDGSLFNTTTRISKLGDFRLRDAITILYETHIDAENATTFTRDEIGDAIADKGINQVWGECYDLVAGSYAIVKQKDKSNPEEPAKSPDENGPDAGNA